MTPQLRRFLDLIDKQIIVSCQAVGKEPFNDVHGITLMAKAVLEGGATVLRLSQPEHIRAIQTLTKFPIIGLVKATYPESDVFITPTIKEVQQLLELNVDCIALDATLRPRPDGEKVENLIKYIRVVAPNTLIMADCSNLEDVAHATKMDVDLIGTTLRGYTAETKGQTNLDDNYQFIKDCLQLVDKPLIAEGGFWDHDDIYNVLKLGATAVVVGTAITRPREITKRYMQKLRVKRLRKGGHHGHQQD